MSFSVSHLSVFCFIGYKKTTGAKEYGFQTCSKLLFPFFSAFMTLIPADSQVTTVMQNVATTEERAWQESERIRSSVFVQMALVAIPATWRRQVRQSAALKVAKFPSWMKPLLPSGPCVPNPCKNDGLCEVASPTRRGDVFNEYICRCQTGFEGVHCQTGRSLLALIHQSGLFVLAPAAAHTTQLFIAEHEFTGLTYCVLHMRGRRGLKSAMAASAVREVLGPLNGLMKGLFSQAVSLVLFG